MRLSKTLLNSLEADKKDKVVWDDLVPGFGVRVKPSGAKTFLVQYRNQFGRMRRYSIGKLGELTLDQARKEARRLKGQIVLGEDPAAKRDEIRQSGTVAELATRYMEGHCKGRCKESTIEAHRWLLDKFIIPRFGNYRLQELSAKDISRFHQSLSETPYNANRVLGLFKAMFGKAEQWGLLPSNQNPAQSLKPFREKKRNRFLSPEELSRLASTIDEQERLGVIGCYQAAAIRLLILTGCRLGEILTLEWRMVDLVNGRLLLDTHKTDQKGIKAIPLYRTALQVLTKLPRNPDSPYVILGRDGMSHLVNLQKPWRRIRNEAGLEEVRIHDLRHSFASAAAAAGVPLQIIGGLLGHNSPQTTARYAHLSQAPIDEAAKLVGSALERSYLAQPEKAEFPRSNS